MSMRRSVYFFNKKSLVLLMMVFAFSLSVDAKKKPKPVFKDKLEIISTPSERGKHISFTGFGSSYFIETFMVHNGTDERIFVEWENSRLDGSRIVFGDDSRLSMGNPKADEAVSAHESSVYRSITGEKKIGSSYQIELYNDRDLKKNIGTKDTTNIKISIRYMDGTIEEFKLAYTAWYEMPEATE